MMKLRTEFLKFIRGDTKIGAESCHQLLYKYSFIFFITIISYGGIYLCFFKAKNIATFCLISGVLCLLTPLVFRVSRSIPISITYLISSGISIVVFTAIYTGGTRSSVLFWLTTMPLTGGYLTRRPWSSIKWFMGALLCLLFVWIHEQTFGKLPSEVSENNLGYVHCFAILGISLFNAILSRLFESELSREYLRVEESRKALAQTQNELFKITSQVAHDIESPLMAMNAISGDLEELSEETKLILRTAIRRVNDIVSSLTYKNFERKMGHQANENEQPRPILVADCIEHIVAEKRAQYRSHVGIEFMVNLDSQSYRIFSVCNEIELRRILSNLINNSIEAISEDGSVTVSLLSGEGYAEIVIKDTGKGIPPSILATLGTRGTTFGKRHGSGLGLSHAKDQLEAWGGKLKIESLIGKGTVVTLAIPTIDRPN